MTKPIAVRLCLGVLCLLAAYTVIVWHTWQQTTACTQPPGCVTRGTVTLAG